MAAALALAERGRGRTAPNPNVGCVIVKDGRVVGRGWTRPGGGPQAEAVALAEAGEAAAGATVYTTLEPCAHRSARGPACADLLAAAGVAEVVAALGDPDPRTDGKGAARLREAGIAVIEGAAEAEARQAMAGFLTRRRLGRPHVTLKLATSLDGRIALASGESRWITGPEARAHAHLERARHEAILVGRGTFEADAPALDVRLQGLEDRSPVRLLLTSRHPGESRGPGWHADSPATLGPGFRRDDDGWVRISSPSRISELEGVDHLLVEGGADTAASFLREGLVDRLILYRAPILIGSGRAALGEIGLESLADAHGRWRLTDARTLGSDRLEVYAAL
jgi:diaminohydroxyphosphoribosylaminopyrimidine deaminase/5-amino-6-(5-phosphoribosylamino)uracil reductase